jgi:hypothetical protein
MAGPAGCRFCAELAKITDEGSVLERGVPGGASRQTGEPKGVRL